MQWRLSRLYKQKLKNSTGLLTVDHSHQTNSNSIGLKTCIGIAAVSGDRTQKAMAHINAWDVATGQDYRPQLANIIAAARGFDNPEITISNPDPGAGGERLRATLEAMIRDCTTEVQSVDRYAAVHTRPLDNANGGEMDIPRSGTIYADDCQYN
jgi:hypothetical protein